MQSATPNLFMVATIAVVLGIAAPATAGDIADCNQSADPDIQIRGCTGFIESGAKGNNLAIAHANRGIAFDALNEIDRAIADFDAAIQVNPKYSIAYYNRGIAHSELGDLDRAIADFDKAIELDPDDPDALDQRGVAFFELRDYGRAIADYDEAVRLDPEFAAAYYHRGIAYGAIAELELGTADYNKALQLGCLRHGWCPAR